VPALPTRQTSCRLLARDRSLARHNLPRMHEARESARVRHLRPVPTMSSHVLAGAIVLVLLPDRAVHGPDRFGCGQSGSRGSAAPLEACGVEYLVGNFDEQVRSSLRWHTLASPALPRLHATLNAPTRRS
jgi:hypothetical protein